MHFVRAVQYVSDYKLLLTFEDGSLRQADLEPYLTGEIFEPIRSIDVFSSVQVSPDLDTIVWENGADMSPDFLYTISSPIAESKRA